MNKKDIKSFVNEILEEFISQRDLEIYDVDFVKEGKDYFLRVYIDRLQHVGKEETYVSTDDCESVSRYLSEKLDEADPIAQNYYLEVASPGMDRELKKEQDFERYGGRLVDVKLYQGLNGKKLISAKLIEKNDEFLILEENDNKIEIPVKNIAKINLAVVF